MPCLPRPLKTALRLSLTALALSLAAAGAQALTASEAELAARLDRLAAELAAVKAQLATLQQQKDQAAAAAPAPAPSAAPATVLTSYAEVNLNHPLHRSQNAQADLRRFVLGVQHRFDEQTKVVSELEVEHGVASADDPGEVEVEQAYVERQLGPVWALRAGLFLMPVGLLNENHEPTAYYGVERNFVETAIIPSTWREGGVQMAGSFDNGLTVQAGLSTGFDIGKWDASSTDGRESPLGSIHQEMALARARDLSVFAALNWRGIPGLLVGGSVFTGGASQGPSAAGSPATRVTLWDLHARWTPGRWDLSALATQGTLSGTAALNRPLIGYASLIPAAFEGGYLQAAYRLWRRQDQALSPFLRWESYNTASRYADLGPGITPAASPTETVWTAGANFQLTPGVVFKADLQKFTRDRDADRLNLGMGWSF